MARMLGERVLPETVQSRRRQLRNRVTDLREPIRNRREDLVPGPDLVSKMESQLTDFRNSFVDRDSVMSRIKEAAPVGDSSGGSSDSGNGGSGSNGSSSTSGGSANSSDSGNNFN